MNITDFVARIGNYKPDGYEFWAGHLKSNYNMEKQVNNTLLLVVPNPFPANYRGSCYIDVRCEIWLGKIVPIKRTTEGTHQHDPYSPLEDRKQVQDIMTQLVALINADEWLAVVSPQVAVTFYDSPDGESVNRQVWGSVDIMVRAWGVAT